MEGQNKSITFDGREIRLTTGLYAPQASGSVMIECGDTSLLVTATKTTKKEVAFFVVFVAVTNKEVSPHSIITDPLA